LSKQLKGKKQEEIFTDWQASYHPRATFVPMTIFLKGKENNCKQLNKKG